MSPGVYRTLTGKILVLGSAVSRLGLNGRMPRPFVVVHSGNTQIIAFGFLACRSLSVTTVPSSFASGFAGSFGSWISRSMGCCKRVS